MALLRASLSAVSLLSALATPSLGFAQVTSPINASSFARAHALPWLGTGAVVSTRAQTSIAVQVANEYVAQNNRLSLDAETSSLHAQLRLPLAADWDWGLRFSALNQSGGALDSAIEHWHGLFGLSNGGREKVARDRLRIRVRDGDQTPLLRTRTATSVGDIHAELGWQLRPLLALRAHLQVPTGDADALSGGHWGSAVWAEGQTQWAKLPATRFDYSLGLSLTETVGPLARQQKPVVVFTRAGFSQPIGQSLYATLHLSSHSALYDYSSTRPLSGPAGVLTMGLGFSALGRQWHLAIDEDLLIHTAPDFSLRLALRL
jgi:hypothetical protein